MVVIKVIILIIHLFKGPSVHIPRLGAILSHRQQLSILLIESRLLYSPVEVFQVLELGWLVFSLTGAVSKDQLP
jgi:hypothetical protein